MLAGTLVDVAEDCSRLHLISKAISVGRDWRIILAVFGFWTIFLLLQVPGRSSG